MIVGLAQFAMGDTRLDGSRFETDENGFAKARAEYAGFSINAVSHCNPTATAANQAIRTIASQIEKVLLEFGDSTVEDGIQSFTETSVKADLIKYQNNQPVTVCTGWRATHRFFFKLTRFAEVPNFQDRILEMNTDNEKVVIGLSEPRPGIFSKTYENLVDSALKDAHQKAIRRVKVLLSDMPQLSEFRLSKVGSTMDSAGSVAYDKTGLGSDPTISNMQAVSVSITRKFQFELK